MNLIYWIVFGAIIGFLADLIDKKHSGSLIVNIVIGILGAVVGGWITGLFNINTGEGFDFLHIIFSVIGALIVLAIYRLITRKA